MNRQNIKLGLFFIIGLLTAFLVMYFFQNYKLEKKNNASENTEVALNNNGNEGNGGVEQGGVFKATVGGQAFVANTSSAIVTNDFVLIAGIRTSNKDLIQITLPSNKVGTYNWANSKDQGDKFVLSYGSVDSENPFISASNEVAEFYGVKNYTDTAIVTITAVDKTKKTISGTFQFTGFRDIGDDKTDESGFKIINELSGMSIKVGAEETRASYRLKNVNAVEKFLDLFSKLLEKNSLSTSQILNGENKCLN